VRVHAGPVRVHDSNVRKPPGRLCRAAGLVALAASAALSGGAIARADTNDIRCVGAVGNAALACRFQPVLVYAPGEAYRARPAELQLQATSAGPAFLRIGNPPLESIPLDGTLAGLAGAEALLLRRHPGAGPLAIDAPAASTDVAGQEAAQREILASAPGQFPLTQYVVVRPERRRVIAIEYWFFYYADALPLTCIAGTQTHEGDWEHVTVLVKRRPGGAVVPLGADFGWHSSSSTVTWASLLHRRRTHPVVFVARGSHASYPLPGDHAPPTRSGSGFVRCFTDHTGPRTATPPAPRERLRWLRRRTPGFTAGTTRLLWGEEPPSPGLVDDEGPVTPVHQRPFGNPLGVASEAAPLAELAPVAALCATTGSELRLVRNGRVVLGYGGPAVSPDGWYVKSLPWLAASASWFSLDAALPNRCAPPAGARGVWSELILRSRGALGSAVVEQVRSPATAAAGRRDSLVLCNPLVYPSTPARARTTATCVGPG
jgi:hypothetical protein